MATTIVSIAITPTLNRNSGHAIMLRSATTNVIMGEKNGAYDNISIQLPLNPFITAMLKKYTASITIPIGIVNCVESCALSANEATAAKANAYIIKPNTIDIGSNSSASIFNEPNKDKIKFCGIFTKILSPK